MLVGAQGRRKNNLLLYGRGEQNPMILLVKYQHCRISKKELGCNGCRMSHADPQRTYHFEAAILIQGKDFCGTLFFID